jgi:hypothetical protein
MAMIAAAIKEERLTLRLIPALVHQTIKKIIKYQILLMVINPIKQETAFPPLKR